MRAIGMTFITLGGNVMSFSLGATLSAATIVFTASLPLGLPVATLAALASSSAFTAVQGWVVGYFGANPIIVSLAALSGLSGLATWITSGHDVYPTGHEGAPACRRSAFHRLRRISSPVLSCLPYLSPMPRT